VNFRDLIALRKVERGARKNGQGGGCVDRRSTAQMGIENLEETESAIVANRSNASRRFHLSAFEVLGGVGTYSE
jgi:hypothetical protein